MRVLRNSAWIFTSGGVTAVLSFFYLAIITRTLGPALFGAFALILSTNRLTVALLRFETWQTIVHFGIKHLESGDTRKFASLAWLCIAIEVTGGLIGTVVIFFILRAMGSYFSWDPSLIQTAQIVAAILMLCPRSSARGILRSYDRFRDGALADSMIPIGRMIGCLLVLAFAPTLQNFLIVWAFSEVLSTVFYWGLVSRNAPLEKPVIRPGFVANTVRENSGFLPFFVNTNLLNSISMLREHAIVIVVGFFVSVESAGLFRLANQLATAVVRISDIFARPLFTELSRIYSSGDFARLSSLFYRSLRMSAIAGAGIIVLLILLGKPFIELMAGNEFLAAYPLLVWMGGATGLRLMGLGLDPLLQASGKSHLSLGVGLGALVVIAIGLSVLLPAYGATGAAITMFIAALATLAALLIIGLRVVKQMKHA